MLAALRGAVAAQLWDAAEVGDAPAEICMALPRLVLLEAVDRLLTRPSPGPLTAAEVALEPFVSGADVGALAALCHALADRRAWPQRRPQLQRLLADVPSATAAADAAAVAAAATLRNMAGASFAGDRRAWADAMHQTFAAWRSPPPPLAA